LTPTVFVVEDDDMVRASVLNLLRAKLYEARGFADPAAFFGQKTPDGLRFLIGDMKMPGFDGLDVAAELTRQGTDIRIIFMSGFGSTPYHA
jgi:FixJ family two-component response regulator